MQANPVNISYSIYKMLHWGQTWHCKLWRKYYLTVKLQRCTTAEPQLRSPVNYVHIKDSQKKHDKDLQFAAKWYYLKLMPNSAVLLNFSPAGTVAKWACMSGTEPGVTSTSPYLLDLFVLGFVLNMQVRSRNHIQGSEVSVKHHVQTAEFQEY